MKFSIYIDQLVLDYWKGKIDFIDCGLIGFIQDLNPDNPEIRKHMWREHFRISLEWLQEELPLLAMSRQAISKRMKKLKQLGILSILDRRIAGEGIMKLTYYKHSGLFWKIHKRRHDEATKAARKVTVSHQPEFTGEKSPVNLESNPRQPELPNESIKDSLSTEGSEEMPKPSSSPQGEELNFNSFWEKIGERRG